MRNSLQGHGPGNARPKLDSTMVNIATILLGGAGLFAVLTDFYVPEVNLAFLDGNPFSEKRAIIQTKQAWIFSLLTLVALLLQLWAQVWGAHLAPRLHQTTTYLMASVVGLALLGTLVWGLSSVGYRLARLEWEPKVIESQRTAFEQAQFVATHDGWTVEHLQQRDQILREGQAERYRQQNLAYVERNLGFIEDLLEVSASGDLRQRVVALEPFFKK